VQDLDLKNITANTIKELITLDVVTPEMYESVFKNKLKEFDNSIEIDDIKVDLVTENLKTITKIQEQTKKSAETFQESIELATTAIDNNDTKTLIEIKEHMIDLQRQIIKLEEEIFTDSLTKVYNRKWLFEKELDDNNFKDNGVLAFVDLDKFKNINDTYGHLAGDKVLILISNLLNKIEESRVIRFGGDEFIVISYKRDINDLKDELEKINSSFKNKSLKFKDDTFKVSVSYGLEKFREGDDFHSVVQVVDEKMYQNKKMKKTSEAL